MSKRSSSGQSNTLLNYFQSPQTSKNKDKSILRDKNLNEDVKDDEAVVVSKKRPRLRIVDTESEDEVEAPPAMCTPPKGSLVKKSNEKKRRRIIAEESSDSDNNEENVTKTPKTNAKEIVTRRMSCFEKTSSTLAETSESNLPIQVEDDSGEKEWFHNGLEFLKPDKIRDINKNLSNHPDYDKNTLFVPDNFLNQQTPAMRQWWTLKSKHFDSVLFFKMGKFYELYHMDAVNGVNYLGLSYMRGKFAHSGFPESAYGKMASSLVEQGFKVARIEQTETPEMMLERCKTMKKSSKFDKIVNREICQITTAATCIYGAQLTDAKQSSPCYMLAIAEQKIPLGSAFGVCFVDTSIGLFHIGNFTDDKHCSRLLTLLSQHPPGLILTERRLMQNTTSEMLKKTLTNIRKDTLASNTQFYSAQKTVDVLMKSCYFRDNNDEFYWPLVLKDLVEDGMPKPEYELGLKALGACIWYLEDSKLDVQLLSMRKFTIYTPIDLLHESEPKLQRDFMVLDSITIQNLNLLGGTGTLQKTLDYCVTAFGRRLLQQWICRPLCNERTITRRQETVSYLLSESATRKTVRGILKKLPDLERQIAKIHVFGNKFCATNHPDGRAVLYETKTYSKRKIHDLLSTLGGFEKAMELIQIFADAQCDSKLLKKLTRCPPEGQFVDLSNTLHFFEGAFDQQQAKTDGKIIPQKGVDDEYDEAEQAIADLNKELEEYLKSQEKFFGCKVKYFGTDKKRYQLEIPENKTKNITTDYQMEGVKKGSNPAKRYSTAETRRLLSEVIKAETKRNKILQDLNRRIFEKFSDRREEWEKVIYCLSLLDVLCSFAEYGDRGATVTCFPKILPFQDKPTIMINSGVHPCTLLNDFIPNDTELGTDRGARIMLLTGPNMGGKSTLMRQVALLTIMAQMGCMVSANNCEISLVDRIFTRIGAKDDIVQGQSTFLSELSEAATILQHATVHSFVLLDELGRGTSTHDGNAIATAYVNKLSEINCRTMFSTHYHTLIEMFAGRNDIQLAHMACMTEEEKDEDNPLTSVTLLYQLREGNCPKSYGFNAARLAGLYDSIIKRAHRVANDFENISIQRQHLRDLLLTDDMNVARSIIRSLA